MSFGQHGRLFQAQASAYACFRPTYPTALYDVIHEFAALDHRGMALDVGTGTGQVAAQLAQSFERVIGVDSSQGQIEHAVQLPNVEYLLAAAEQVPQVASGSVDLATVAQALHW
jgi:ubiquinone/menaquinone biosynthesis C-methylase UbiE